MGDTVIPDGDFTLEVTKSNWKDQGDGSMGLLIKVVGDDEGQPLPDDDEAAGVNSWTNLYFSEKAAGISFRTLKQLGFDETFLAQSESGQEIADAAVGIVFTASVGHRTWGKDGDRVSNEFKAITVVTPPSVGGVSVDPTEPDPDEEAY
jgi:hypothetical protein